MENYFSIAALYHILGIPKLYNISPIYKYFGLFVTVDNDLYNYYQKIK